MILHDNFVFIHHPHSAGLFTQSILCKYVPEDMDDYNNNLQSKGNRLSLNGIKYHNHNGVIDIPYEYEDKFKFGIVKNPYIWYVSYYYYNLRSETDLKEEELNNFDSFMDSMNSIYEYNKLGRYSGFFTNLFTYENKFAENDILCDLNYLCDVRNLIDELFNVFDITNTKLNNEQKEWIINLKKYNTSDYNDYREFYTDELIDKVSKWDKSIIEHFNYKFE